jgi:uncharacterized membrane protein
MLIFGACNTLLMKLLSRQVLPPAPGAEPQSFVYPFFQTLVMMVGMFLCLLAHHFSRCTQSARPSADADAGKAATFPKWILGIPAAFDLAGTTFIHAAYAAIPASVVQMCRGSLVLFTCILSELCLARRHARHQYIGVGLVTIGLLTVAGHSVLVGTPQSTLAIPAWVGVLSCLIGELCLAVKIVVEERYFGKYPLEPLELVGYEGLFGIAMTAALLVALEYFRMERTSEAWYMMQSSAWVSVPVCMAACSIACFNWAGGVITKQASAVARSTIDVSRTVIIWAVELMLLWNVFSAMQCAGFLILVCGTLTYNRVLPLPTFMASPPEEKSLV